MRVTTSPNYEGAPFLTHAIIKKVMESASRQPLLPSFLFYGSLLYYNI